MNTSNPFIDLMMDLLDNAVLSWALVACGFAQLSKLFVELIKNKRFRIGVLFETGGMPSSHSALVTAAAAGVGLELGFDHSGFALASTIAFIVMYDASGIRRSAGLIASKLNQLPADLFPSELGKDLKENLGHTRLEVLVGSLIGPLIALPGIVFLGSPIHLFHLIR